MKLGSGELYLNYLNYPNIPTIPTISTPLGMFQTKAESNTGLIPLLQFHIKSKTGLGTLLTMLRGNKKEDKENLQTKQQTKTKLSSWRL